MEPIHLQLSIDKLLIVNTLKVIIGILETIFPGRIRGYYLLGSYANGTAVVTSDLDITILFKGHASEQLKEQVWNIGDYASQFASIFLDLNPIGEDQLSDASEEGFHLRTGSRHLYGEDVRPAIPAIPIDTYIQSRLKAAYHFIVKVARNNEQTTFPLNFPDPNGEFYGYDNDPIEGRKDTKLLVAIVTQVAAALVAHQARVYVPSKYDAIILYHQHINDEWVELIDDVFTTCRQQWAYRLPDEKLERKKLRQLCQRVLAFENYFLEIYHVTAKP
jgi:hypothetical protein